MIAEQFVGKENHATCLIFQFFFEPFRIPCILLFGLLKNFLLLESLTLFEEETISFLVDFLINRTQKSFTLYDLLCAGLDFSDHKVKSNFVLGNRRLGTEYVGNCSYVLVVALPF